MLMFLRIFYLNFSTYQIYYFLSLFALTSPSLYHSLPSDLNFLILYVPSVYHLTLFEMCLLMLLDFLFLLFGISDRIDLSYSLCSMINVFDDLI